MVYETPLFMGNDFFLPRLLLLLDFLPTTVGTVKVVLLGIYTVEDGASGLFLNVIPLKMGIRPSLREERNPEYVA
ncbi:MAG: hypothetical protein AAB444_02610 [Patescibacteria group bacterium]